MVIGDELVILALKLLLLLSRRGRRRRGRRSRGRRRRRRRCGGRQRRRTRGHIANAIGRQPTPLWASLQVRFASLVSRSRPADRPRRSSRGGAHCGFVGDDGPLLLLLLLLLLLKRFACSSRPILHTHSIHSPSIPRLASSRTRRAPGKVYARYGILRHTYSGNTYGAILYNTFFFFERILYNT